MDFSHSSDNITLSLLEHIIFSLTWVSVANPPSNFMCETLDDFM